MELTVLGSGTYQPEIERASSGYLIRADGQNIVFDFGRCTLDNLIKAGVNYWDIDAIFITHTHPDHFGGIVPFLHIAIAEDVQFAKRNKDVTIYGPKGIAKSVEHILFAFNLTNEKPKFKISIKELGNGEVVQGNGWVVKSYAVKHEPDMNCMAYRLEAGRKVFAYSGDCVSCPGLKSACDHADLAVVEASWPKEMSSKTHMTGEDAGKVAKECRVGKLLLTHAAPYYLENFDVIGDAASVFNGSIAIASDMMKLKI